MKIELRDLEKAELKEGKHYALFVSEDNFKGVRQSLDCISEYVGCTFVIFPEDVRIKEIEKERCNICKDFIDECYCPENENVKRNQRSMERI